MQLSSQRDPAYGGLKLGSSKLTVYSYGCFVASIATLYQRPVEELLKVAGAFAADGNLNSSVLARHCGGEALPRTTKPPRGWCIAVTDNYKEAGYPTHFFCYNADTGERIDPLDFPAKVEGNAIPTYNITQYRPFTNIKLDTSIPQPVPVFPDVEVGRDTEADIVLCKERGIIKGFPDGLFRPTQTLTREQGAAIAARIIRHVEALLSASHNGSKP